MIERETFNNIGIGLLWFVVWYGGESPEGNRKSVTWSFELGLSEVGGTQSSKKPGCLVLHQAVHVAARVTCAKSWVWLRKTNQTMVVFRAWKSDESREASCRSVKRTICGVAEPKGLVDKIVSRDKIDAPVTSPHDDLPASLFLPTTCETYPSLMPRPSTVCSLEAQARPVTYAVDLHARHMVIGSLSPEVCNDHAALDWASLNNPPQAWSSLLYPLWSANDYLPARIYEFAPALGTTARRRRKLLLVSQTPAAM